MTADSNESLLPAGYRYVSTLGRGGMGVVYRATHEATGQSVALKRVLATGPGAVASLRREIRALRRISCSGVVSVLDEGLLEGMPWYAMEYLDGRSLAAHLREPGGPDARARHLRWVGQVCHALAVVHGEGLVHCDLKPANIVIAGDRAVLVDFGLAARFGARLGSEALDAYGAVVGTPGYMAPERVQGHGFDARADLYAVGCILYEVVTGRPPFVGPGSTPLLQHVAAPVVPPSDLGAAVSPRLEKLIVSLLAKRPHDRPGHGYVVSEALRGEGVDLRVPSDRPGPLLFQPPLLGRDAELAWLEQQWIGAAAQGCCVGLFGPTGSGKTRLVAELVARARVKDVPVLTAYCHRGDSPTPFAAARGLLQPVVDAAMSNPGLGDIYLSGRVRVLAELFPELLGLDAAAAEPPPAELPAQMSQERLAAACVATLRAYCGHRCAVLIVDGIHRADAATLTLLRRAVADMPGWTALWVVLGRREEFPPALDSFLGDHRIPALDLEPLPDEAVQGVLAGVLGVGQAPAGFAATVLAHAVGNPWFVVEYVRLAVERGELAADRRGRWSVVTAEMPAKPTQWSAAQIAAGRVEFLPARVRRLCAMAAVLGMEVDVPLLVQVADLNVEDVRDGLRVLEGRQFLESAGPLAMRFVSEALRTQVLATTPDEDRKRFHRRAAEALDARYAMGSPVDRASLGRHWAKVGAVDAAVEHLRAAGSMAARQFALDAALACWNDAIALLEEADERAVQLRLDRVQHVLMARAEHRAAAEELADLEPLPPLGLRIQGRLLNVTGAWAEALPVLQAALAGYQAVGDGAASAEVVKDMANVLHNQHRTDEAMALYQRAAAMQRARGDGAALARVLVNIAMVEARRGDAEAGQATLEEAHRLFLAEGDLGGCASARMNLGITLRKQEKYDEAIEAYRDAMALFDRAGNELMAAMSRNNLAIALSRQGRPSEAVDILEEVADTALRLGDRKRYGRARYNQIFSLKALGQTARALSCCEAALEVRRGGQDVAGLANALAMAAELCLDLGQRDRAVAYVAECDALGPTFDEETNLPTVRERLRADDPAT